jgi:hypothetical protein
MVTEMNSEARLVARAAGIRRRDESGLPIPLGERKVRSFGLTLATDARRTVSLIHVRLPASITV